jgi:hypothetical protein
MIINSGLIVDLQGLLIDSLADGWVAGGWTGGGLSDGGVWIVVFSPATEFQGPVQVLGSLYSFVTVSGLRR